MKCPKCESEIKDDCKFCTVCGEAITESEVKADTLDNTANNNQNECISDDLNKLLHPKAENPSSKSRLICALLAGYLGFCGAHLFYVGKITAGVFCAIFWWSGVPAIISFVHLILILCGKFSDKDNKVIAKW